MTQRFGAFPFLTAVVVLALFAASPASADPITFTPTQYDNTANTVTAGPTPVNNQTTGLFRDVFWWSLNNGAPRVDSPDFINAGNSLILVSNHAVEGSGPYTALNFTGPSVSGGQSYLSIFDNLAVAGSNVFDASVAGGLTLSADILFVKHNSSGGIVALYNGGQNGLALLANNQDGNNADYTRLSLVWQSPGQGSVLLASAALPSNTFCTATDGGVGCTTGDHWYKIVMNLSVTGDTYSVTGSFYNHLDPSDPTSGLGSLLASLSTSGSLSAPGNGFDLTNPGQVGLMAMGNESISLPDNIGVSITNFDIGSPVPEPASLMLLGTGLVGLGGLFRRMKKH